MYMVERNGQCRRYRRAADAMRYLEQVCRAGDYVEVRETGFGWWRILLDSTSHGDVPVSPPGVPAHLLLGGLGVTCRRCGRVVREDRALWLLQWPVCLRCSRQYARFRAARGDDGVRFIYAYLSGIGPERDRQQERIRRALDSLRSVE